MSQVTAINPKKYQNQLFLYLLIVGFGIFAALFLSFFANAKVAYANCVGGVVVNCGDGGDTILNPPITGGNDGGGGNGGNEPTRTSRPYEKPGNSASFSVVCANWSGSGSWQLSANCNNTVNSVKNANPLAQKENAIEHEYVEWKTPGLYGRETCGPSGTISAFKQNWFAKYSTFGLQWVLIYPDGTSKLDGTQQQGIKVSYAFQGCSYPQPQYQYNRCYWNNQGQIDYSANRLAHIGSWSRHYTRTPQAGDPAAPTGGTGNTAPQGRCTNGTSVSNFVNVASDVDKYGYYSAMYSFNSRLYTQTQYVGDGRVWYDAGWQAGGTQAHSSRNFFTYSCVPTGGNAVAGPYWSQAGTPNVDNFLNPATCPQVSWQCVADTPTTIGLDRAAVLSGTLSPNRKASAMRNGEAVPIDFSRIRVIDTSTARDIDVTDGQAAPSVRNITNISYRTTVKPGSTPFYGSDANANTQYFKMYTDKTAKAQETFGAWKNHVNSNLDKAISFNWASDNENKGFALQRQYRVTGQFFVPGGSSVGSGGAGASPGYEWLDGSYDCRDFSGRGSGRVDLGPLTTTSNDITVVRSVNK